MAETHQNHLETFLDAIHEGDLNQVRRGLERGVSGNWRDQDGASALFYALYRRDWPIAEALLAHGADIDAPDEEGWTPLFWAASSGYADVVAFLVGHNADANIKTADGEWGLFWAAVGGYLDIVRLLLKGGARRDWLRTSGRDAIELTERLGHKEIKELLVNAEGE